MAKTKTPKTEAPTETDDTEVTIVKPGEVQSLSQLMSKKAIFNHFAVWLIGDTPLITHAWSEKAKREMLQKQVKSVKAGKEARDPQQDFISSLYEMGKDAAGKDIYGFPAMGVKNCILSSAHKDKGIARSAVLSALSVDADMVRVRPALAGAVCDMPLLRIYGGEPEMREDMVKIGAGLNKTANLAYRGQFTVWALKLTGKYNSAVLTGEQLAFLIMEAGTAYGLGEWRNEKKGMFGAFHLASAQEEVDWNAYAGGTGKLPVPDGFYQQAAE